MSYGVSIPENSGNLRLPEWKITNLNLSTSEWSLKIPCLMGRYNIFFVIKIGRIIKIGIVFVVINWRYKLFTNCSSKIVN